MEEEKECKTDGPIGGILSDSIGLQRIDLALDHPQKVYYCGCEITGKVYLDLNEPISAIGIRLKCKGEAQVYFTDRSAGIRRKFSAFENYLHSQTYLVGDGKEKCAISGGAYPFALTLPENLPCSFEGRYGRVRYSIRALLDVTSVYRFSTGIIPFTVAPILDLNRDPLAPLSLNESQSKLYVGQTESLGMTMSLPVRGYVPGQTIPVQVHIQNPSNVIVRKLRIVFKKVVTYHATEKSRKHKEIVVEIEQPIENDRDNYDVPFDIPAVPPTGMLHCNIIGVVYTLKVEACVDVSEWYYKLFLKNLKIRTTIIVGTIPLHTYESPEAPPGLYPQRDESVEKYADNSTGKFAKNSEDEARAETSLPSMPMYEKSQIYRSSKPDRDDPTGDEGDSDGEVKPYSPMYRVYKFKRSPGTKVH